MSYKCTDLLGLLIIIERLRDMYKVLYKSTALLYFYFGLHWT